MSYYLGIDLGTTYTAAALERDGLVESLTLGNRTASVPSVVFLRDDGEILVGEAATRRATSEPGRVAREFKRRVGDPTPIILGGTPYAAEMLMARMLRWSVDKAREQQGADPLGIALTHPANWGPYKLDLLTQAVRQVDVEAALLLPEPVAAATFYASQRRLDPNAVVAVYDLGGGTFDAAMVRRTATGFEIIGSPEGIERLGGIDFDEAVSAHVRSAIGEALDGLDPEEPASVAAMTRLRQECIDAKEALSSDTDVSIPVFLPNLQTEVRLTRSEFEDMIRPAISETIVALRRSIRSAGVTDDQISAVLLVGGSSRIPLVAQMVGAELGRPIAIDAHPKDAISFGAAIAVSHKSGRSTPESVTTVLPRDPRPPPPTVVPANHRPPPPGARPAPPVGAPVGPMSRPAPPGPRPAPPTGARPAPPAARPAPPAAQPAASARPVPPTVSSGNAASPTTGAGSGPAAAAAQPGAPANNTGAGARQAGPSATASGAASSTANPARPAPPGSGPGAAPRDRATPPTSPPGPARPVPPGGVAASGPTAASPTRPAAPSSAGGPYAAGAPGAARPPVPPVRPGVGPTSGGYPAQHRGPVSSGGYPAQRPSMDEDHRILLIAIAVVATILLVIIVLLINRGGGDDAGGDSGTTTTETSEQAAPADYDDPEFRSNFFDSCTGDGNMTQSECECVMDYLVANVPIDDAVEWSDDNSTHPAINGAVADCQSGG
jgi:actin-like ATPase involved in cell morphogenesis